MALTSADHAWEAPALDATDPMPASGPYSGFVRRVEGDVVHYAYFGGRTAWRQGEGGVSEGYLFEVSPTLRSRPKHYPSDSRTFRSLGEAMITDAPELLPELAKAYR